MDNSDGNLYKKKTILNYDYSQYEQYEPYTGRVKAVWKKFMCCQVLFFHIPDRVRNQGTWRAIHSQV